MLRFDTLTPPNHYGPPQLGRIEVYLDGAKIRTLHPRSDAGEIVLWRAAQIEKHQFSLVHRRDGEGVGCRIRGVRLDRGATGDLSFLLSGEHQEALIDARAIVTLRGTVVRDSLVRNWLSGQCRLAGLPPGDDYDLEVRALGWRTERREGIRISDGRETVLEPLYLRHAWDPPGDDFKFPALGRAAIVLPGGKVRARFSAHQARIQATRLVRREDPATISRRLAFEEDEAAAYYYHREGSINVPNDMPAGLYDLEIAIVDRRKQERTLVSARAVSVLRQLPTDPVFVSFGHLDTWGQEQAEYLARIVEMANVIAPDAVLDSTEANPAYAAGALLGLRMPCVVNFGNHRFPEPAAWFGDPVSAVDFGPRLTIVNNGRAWDSDTSEVQQLLEDRRDVAIKLLNAFEPNAPVAGLLDRHRIALLHYAHGPGPNVNSIGSMPTVRVGKANSESFRIIRFEGERPKTYTYRGHATAPIPFPRRAETPVRIVYQQRNDGTAAEVKAEVTNELEETVPRARVTFVLPAGEYRVSQGMIEDAVASDDGKFTVVNVRVDLPAKSRTEVRVTRAR